MREIAAPVFAMIRRWVFEGELLDPHAEFFVAARTGVKEVDLWQSKYVKWVQMDDVGHGAMGSNQVKWFSHYLRVLRYLFQMT